MSKSRILSLVLFLALVGAVIAADAPEKKDLKFTPEQQKAADAVAAHGGLVLRVAANTDTLDVLFNLSGKAGTDAAVAHVKALPNVIKLNLAGTDITDKGVAEIAGLKSLTELHLERTKVTDAALASLKGLENLSYLNVYDTPITDAGLAHLHGLKNLKKLYLWQSKATDAGVEAIKKAIPGIYVNNGWVAPKEAPVPVTPPPATPATPATSGKLSIKQIMEKAHKGNDTLLTRSLAKKAKPEEVKELLGYYQALTALKPGKGDEASWKAKTAALVAAADLLVKNDDKGLAGLKAASDCKACHSVHK